MSTLAQLKVDLIGSSAAFRSEMVRGQRQANKSLAGIRRDAELAGRALRALGVGFSVLGAGAAVRSLVQAQVQMQQIDYTLRAATGGAQQAAEAFNFVREESQKLGLSLQPTAQAFARLSASASAMHVPMHQQKDLFDAFAKASTVLHLSADESSRALLALEQMFSKGKIQAQELRLQLGQAIPGAAERFQQAVLQMTKGTDLQGKSFDQLLQSGALVTDRFIPALIESFAGASTGWQEASDSLNSNIGRLQTAWFDLKVAVTDGPFNQATNSIVRQLAGNLEDVAGVIRTSTGPAAANLAKGWTLVELAIRDTGTTAAWMVQQLRVATSVAESIQPQRRVHDVYQVAFALSPSSKKAAWNDLDALNNKAAQTASDAAAAFKRAWSDYQDALTDNDKRARDAFEDIDRQQQQSAAVVTATSAKRTDAMEHEAKAATKLAKAHKSVADATKKSAQVAANRTAALQQQLADRLSRRQEQNAIDAFGVGHGQQETQQLQDQLRIRQEYDRARLRYEREARANGTVGSEAYSGDLAKMAAAQQQELALYQAGVQTRLDAEADWHNGAIAAMEDWRDAAANVSGQVADMVTNAANNMTDAFVQFALTGKLSFKDFADSVIKDLARIAYQKAIAGIFDMVLGAIGPSAGSGYIGGNGTGGYGMEMQNASSGGQYGLSFGGGRASGGSTSGGTIYEVAEGGKPELYQSAGRTYLLSVNDGHVTPARSGSVAGGITAGGGINVVIENHTDVRPQVSHSTGANGQPLIKILMKQVDDRMTQNAANPSSPFGKALSGVYGLQRRGVPVGS